MSSDGSDILMQLRLDSGPVPAECQTEVDSDADEYVWDYFNGTFFEVKSFSFGMKIDDKDTVKDGVNRGGQTSANASNGNRVAPPKLPGHGSEGKDAGGAFARWKTASAAELKAMKRYPVRMDEFEIARDFDRASPVLFKYCCDSGSFKSASLVKRKDVGGNMLRGFLRLEFEDVLITHVGWSNEEIVKEKFKFIFRKVNVRYRATSFKRGQQEPILQELPAVNWSFDTDLINSKQAL